MIPGESQPSKASTAPHTRRNSPSKAAHVPARHTISQRHARAEPGRGDGRATSTQQPKTRELHRTHSPRKWGLYSIDACIRNFRMMGQALDMENPTSSYRVGSCFANPEKGIYFDGTGYAKAGEAQYFTPLQPVI
ncbi:unnamed protein product [Leuciscus chuanchicus]